jgi:hypothetical protein
MPFLYDGLPEFVSTGDLIFFKAWAEEHAEVTKFGTLNNTNRLGRDEDIS